ncbi:MAG: hypothetical protein NDF54_12220, partial [archaeon GB-1867-035]|nr:hypothetical protein [Candidatus Culexmicrobium profundum]
NIQHIYVEHFGNATMHSPVPIDYVYNNGSNSLYYSYLGNYWSSYNGVDNNGDGIGDNPYTVVDNIVDEYPLVKSRSNYKVLENSSSSGAKLSIESTSIPYGSSKLIPVIIETTVNLGGYDILVQYDSSILKVENVIGGEAPFCSPNYSIDNIEGMARISQFIDEPMNSAGKMTIFYLNITAIQMINKPITVYITIINLIDADTGKRIIPRKSINGEINVTCLKNVTSILIDLKPVTLLNNSMVIPIKMRINGTIENKLNYNLSINISFVGTFSIQGVFPGDNPFDLAPLISVSNSMLSLKYTNVPGGNWNKTLCYLPIILNGSVNDIIKIGVNVGLIIQEIMFGERIMPNVYSSHLQLIRGDANGDNKVTITDAMFIAQYLAGNRPLSDLNPINAASIKHDSDDGDIITIADAMFIAQYLAGLRDEYFELIGGG